MVVMVRHSVYMGMHMVRLVVMSIVQLLQVHGVLGLSWSQVQLLQLSNGLLDGSRVSDGLRQSVQIDKLESHVCKL